MVDRKGDKNFKALITDNDLLEYNMLEDGRSTRQVKVVVKDEDDDTMTMMTMVMTRMVMNYQGAMILMLVCPQFKVQGRVVMGTQERRRLTFRRVRF